MDSSGAPGEERTAGAEQGYVDVPFHVPHERSGPLTWGQQRVAELTEALAPHQAALNLRFAWRVRPGVTTEGIAAAAKELLEECESLRTLFDLDPHAGQQRVVSEGTVRVPLITVDAATDALAQELTAELAAAEFGPAELPIRMSLMADRDGPAYLLFAVSHLASDFLGARRLVWHLRRVLVFTPRPADDSLVTTHPVDIAVWENGEGGRRSGERALLQHERNLRRMPQSMLPRIAIEPMTPRYQYVEIRTAAGALCLSHLAERHGVSETAVGHAALSLVLAHVSSLQRAHLQVCVGNRFDRGVAAAVASLTQDVPTCVTVDDTDFDTLLRRSAGAVRQATMTGRFPHKGLVDVRRRIERERGFPLDLSFWLNSRLFTPVSVEAPTDARLRAQLARTCVRWLGGDQSSTSTLFAYLDRFDDLLAVRMLVDTAYVTRDDAEAWLRAFESILVAAARRPDIGVKALAADTGLLPFDPTADWARIDHSWIHLPTATARLREAFPGVALRVAVDMREGEPSLVGVVRGQPSGDQVYAPADADFVAQLRDCKVAIRPHRFLSETDVSLLARA